MTVVGPGSGASLTASRLVSYNTDEIYWPSLASLTGTTASSSFLYPNPSGALSPVQVKASVSGIRAGASASTLAG
jgi:hypothetical protein